MTSRLEVSLGTRFMSPEETRAARAFLRQYRQTAKGDTETQEHRFESRADTVRRIHGLSRSRPLSPRTRAKSSPLATQFPPGLSSSTMPRHVFAVSPARNKKTLVSSRRAGTASKTTETGVVQSPSNVKSYAEWKASRGEQPLPPVWKKVDFSLLPEAMRPNREYDSSTESNLDDEEEEEEIRIELPATREETMALLDSVEEEADQRLVPVDPSSNMDVWKPLIDQARKHNHNVIPDPSLARKAKSPKVPKRKKLSKISKKHRPSLVAPLSAAALSSGENVHVIDSDNPEGLTEWADGYSVAPEGAVPQQMKLLGSDDDAATLQKSAGKRNTENSVALLSSLAVDSEAEPPEHEIISLRAATPLTSPGSQSKKAILSIRGTPNTVVTPTAVKCRKKKKQTASPQPKSKPLAVGANVELIEQLEVLRKAQRSASQWISEGEAVAVIMLLLGVIALLWYRALLVV